MTDEAFVPEDVEAAILLARRLTPARMTALAVLVSLDTEQIRYSNVTSYERGTVYWQSANWLSQQGLVRITDGKQALRDGMVVTITALGRWVYFRRLDGPL